MLGRKISLVSGGITFLIGAAINGAAMNVAVLIIDRILLGIGVGFANQWRRHRFWKRVLPAADDEEKDANNGGTEMTAAWRRHWFWKI
ncbi:unnamed protein product [Victoria cruziana]